jgi:hypothetical protein
MSGTVLREPVKFVSANPVSERWELWPEMASPGQQIVGGYCLLDESVRPVRPKLGTSIAI